MLIDVTDKPESPEAEMYADSVIIDQSGVDLIMGTGEVFSGNWGDLMGSEVGQHLIELDFIEESEAGRAFILNDLYNLVNKLEKINKNGK